ncbi:putative holo-[acyl-carrier-protein] synthase [Leptospira broomii serovar Hurstbridge str. 5399]|uniref:Holo-[acyl-carrier-protein] synthase n=1 Tax=Leptospira broomii serovar Hurstbridge str. 5399 TaxID=1049789 RepID=T0GHA0_9LEPT|nr:holo-ACP synthase [Leptospira broomii]EQA44778.1 putative holo-[acyl-carrier-protein] synthase [Leptospira broomii serovar Hurstbridge str. 5399]
MTSELDREISEVCQPISPDISVGVDLVFIPEFREALAEPGTVFFKETFTDWERAKADTKPALQRATYYAGRYAAKEALIKALDGPRLHLDAAFRPNYIEIEVRNDNYGRPYFRFYGILSDYMEKIKSSCIRISITHAGDYAFSEVLLAL